MSPATFRIQSRKTIGMSEKRSEDESEIADLISEQSLTGISWMFLGQRPSSLHCVASLYRLPAERDEAPK